MEPKKYVMESLTLPDKRTLLCDDLPPDLLQRVENQDEVVLRAYEQRRQRFAAKLARISGHAPPDEVAQPKSPNKTKVIASSSSSSSAFSTEKKQVMNSGDTESGKNKKAKMEGPETVSSVIPIVVNGGKSRSSSVGVKSSSSSSTSAQMGRQLPPYLMNPVALNVGANPPPSVRYNGSSTSSSNNGVLPLQIPVTDVDALTNRVAATVHMIEELLWPQYSTQGPRPNVSEETATSYWNALYLVCSSADIETIKDALLLYSQCHTTPQHLMYKVAECLAGEDKLIMGFDIFLPVGLSMTALLVMQKVAVSLACMIDREISHDVKRQKEIARKAMKSLEQVLKESKYVPPAGYPVTALPPRQNPQQPPMRVPSIVSLETSPVLKNTDPEEHLRAIGGQWLDAVQKVYGPTSPVTKTVYSSVIELTEPGVEAARRKQLIDQVNEMVQGNLIIKDMFLSFCHEIHAREEKKADLV